MKSVCVYCGSASGARSEYADAARALGEAIARRKMSLVYGGAHVGLMGIVADSALAAGGRVEGVIPHRLQDRELAHPNLSELHVVDTMAERKDKMASLSDAFIALPGGLGTLDELFETMTWTVLYSRQAFGCAGRWRLLAALVCHAGDNAKRRFCAQALA